MTHYAIATDLNRCMGCLACSVACKAMNNVPVGDYWNKSCASARTRRPTVAVRGLMWRCTS